MEQVLILRSGNTTVATVATLAGSQTKKQNTHKSVLNTGVSGTILNGLQLATQLATQQSIKAYIATQV